MANVVAFDRLVNSAEIRELRKSLPPADTVRWVASRKEAVVKAIEKGAISEEDACRNYDLSPEELEIWREAIDRYGRNALLVTKLQHFRNGG